MTILKLPLIAMGFLTISTSVMAQSLKTDGQLIDATVRAFYQESRTSFQKPFSQYQAFMQSHIADDAEFTINSIAIVDGLAPQTDTIKLDKNKMLSTAEEDYKNAQGMKIDEKINSIQIAPDGKTAFVKNITVLTKEIKSAELSKTGTALIQSQSLCDETLTLNIQQEPQISKSTCTTKTKVSPK